ncbi:hypothetical protein E2C01_066910 [Portunus trituberculatus]|uniref:Uncharacterized protein n=1 Tax=Portunus trituberculatus TaxID=210409 RepID=A0A5B7HV58_PORTR|nr:hypothetical protein [Portunus trituberculatus]
MSGEERGWWVLVVMVSVAASGYTQGLGDVHTSAASVARLVEAEQAVVAALQDYVTKEDARLEVIRRYVQVDLSPGPRDDTGNN